MKYGFGIVGIGMIANFHAKAIEKMEGGTLVACYSRSQAKADKFAAEHHCKGYSDFDAFLRDP